MGSLTHRRRGDVRYTISAGISWTRHDEGASTRWTGELHGFITSITTVLGSGQYSWEVLVDDPVNPEKIGSGDIQAQAFWYAAERVRTAINKRVGDID